DRRNREGGARGLGGHCASAGSLSWYVGGILAGIAERLRTRKSQRRAGGENRARGPSAQARGVTRGGCGPLFCQRQLGYPRYKAGDNCPDPEVSQSCTPSPTTPQPRSIRRSASLKPTVKTPAHCAAAPISSSNCAPECAAPSIWLTSRKSKNCKLFSSMRRRDCGWARPCLASRLARAT